MKAFAGRLFIGQFKDKLPYLNWVWFQTLTEELCSRFGSFLMYKQSWVYLPKAGLSWVSNRDSLGAMNERDNSL